MMRVLVTGASGFVGRGLAPALAQKGMEVVAGSRDGLRIPRAPGITPIALPDLATPIDWAPFLRGIDAVIHLAGIAHAGPGIAEERYLRVNRDATAMLAKAAAAAGVKRLVFLSSIRAQSGPVAEHILTEADQPRPSDAYGRSKLAAEEAVRRSGVPFTILRPVVIYGPGVKGNVASLMTLAALPLPLPFAALHAPRSLLALDNLISAIAFTLAAPLTAGETYLVCDPAPVSLADIVAMLRRAQGRTPMLFPLPPALLASVLRMAGRGDLWERLGGALVADAGKLRAAGWAPVTDTPTALTALDADQLQARQLP
jgi:nucleoside-diphosphate-sugar epimerase